MSTIPFNSLTDSARLWIFASDKDLTGESSKRMLAEVDRYLENWQAHGSPLTCAREWREDRFLAIGVEGPQASGCSIDGLFRTLKALEPAIGATLVGEGLVFYKRADGRVTGVSRDEFRALFEGGSVGADTRLFDSSLTLLWEYRDGFETSAGESWHRKLLREKPPADGYHPSEISHSQ